MATLKSKDIRKMSESDREKKLKELRVELVKSNVHASKTGSAKIKEIKKIIARILNESKKSEASDKKEELKKQ